jgi:anhydro-N-acetylmuramic acid kinase
LNPSAIKSTADTPEQVHEFYIGLMSGTSMDGVDSVLVQITGPSEKAGAGTLSQLTVIGHVHCPYDEPLVDELLSLNGAGVNELHRAALAANAVSQLYAQAVDGLLRDTGIKPEQITAIASHGQTVRHQPRLADGSLGYTLQLNQPALLAEWCGIDVIADFRSRDVAAGGQGAPLVPAFHQAIFAEPGADRAVLNVGGISNLSLLKRDGTCLGLDCGPGNVLMDHWCKKHTGAPYDDAGQWAAQGQVNQALLDVCLSDAYFARPAPKSTGRDLFNKNWLAHKLMAAGPVGSLKAIDVQATLVALTAQSITHELQRAMHEVQSLYVCGGGAYNKALMSALTQALPSARVDTTAALGVPPEQVEAAAFAWLAWAHKHRVPGNVPAVTGAKGPRVLGALYPAR